MHHWLMKAEPDTRLEKGIDVAFSVDHFERIRTSCWDGVRSHEAKKIMKERMHVGDRVLFYHSNCRVPGVAALATVSKEGYPDHTAWDPEHPYYDAKSSQEKPTWFMVDVTFESRLDNLVPLKLLQHLSALETPPPELSYLERDHLEAIKEMPLLKRGRLSVQPVSSQAFEAIVQLGVRGGFDDFLKMKGGKKTKAAASEPDLGDAANKAAPGPTAGTTGAKRRAGDGVKATKKARKE